MSIATVRKELTQRLIDWASSQNPPIPVTLEGEAFDKPEDGSSFLEAFILPANTLNPTLDGRKVREVGIFQVNCWIKDGGEVQGAGRSDRLSQSIVDLFPVIPKFSPVSVDQTPSISKPIPEDGWKITPVTIQYRLETQY